MADLAGRTSEQGKDYLIGPNFANTNTECKHKYKYSEQVSTLPKQIQNTDTNTTKVLAYVKYVCNTELDGDLLSVYGCPAIKYLERPWNKQRAQVT